MCRQPYQRIFLAILLTLCPCALAQEGVKLRFLAFPKSPSSEPLELQIGENKTIEIETPGNELSQEYEIPQLASIVVGKTIKNEKYEELFQVYGSAKTLAAKEQIVLLLRKGAASSDGFVVLPVSGDQANFSGASFLFINASNLSVGGLIGDQKFALKPGQKRTLKPTTEHPDGICQVTLSYQKGEAWKAFYDTRWLANSKCRSIIFFYQDPQSGRLGIAPIMDVLPYKEE